MTTHQDRPGQPTAPNLPALRILAEALRMPLPKNFSWYIGTYPRCAWGVAYRLGLVETDRPMFDFTTYRDCLGLDYEAHRHLFCPFLHELQNEGYASAVGTSDITPAVQAARIDKFVDEAEATARELVA